MLLIRLFALFWITTAFAQVEPKDSINIYLADGDKVRALRYALTLSERFESKGDLRALTRNTVKLSKVYEQLNEPQKSINALFRVLRLVEKKNMAFEQAMLCNEIGNNYFSTYNYKKALHYHLLGEKFAERTGNDTLKSFVRQGFFRLYLGQRKMDSTKIYMDKILKVNRNSPYPELRFRAYSNYATYYLTKADAAFSKKYLDTALTYALKIKKQRYLTGVYDNLGYYYSLLQPDFKKAISFYNKILEINPLDTISPRVTDAYLNISYSYEKLGDYKTANHYMSKYIDNTTAIFQDKLNAQLKDSETKYKIAKVEDAYKQRQAEMLELQSKNHKIFITTVALLLLLSILFYFYTQNARLKEKNKLKDVQGKLQENVINATIDGQEQERKKIAGVLHDSISAQLSSAGLHLQAYSATTGNDAEAITKTRAILKDAHDKVRDLSHELLPTLLAKFGLLYALEDQCEKNSNALTEFRFENTYPFRTRFPEDFEMKVYFMVTELMNNILKHAGASVATLSVSGSSTQLTVVLSDNGKGFDSTNIQTQEGFGLTQIRVRTSHMGGTFRIDSKPGQGATFTLELPVS